MKSTLLEKWLSQRIGYCVRLNSADVGRLLYDGKVFYDLLNSYGVINIEMFGGLPGRQKKSTEEAFKSLAQLCDTFRLLNIDIDDNYLQGIAEGKGTYAVRLLNQLYLKLEDKRFIDIITSPKGDNVIQQEIKDKITECNKYMRGSLDGGSEIQELSMIKLYEDASKGVIERCNEDIRQRRENMQRAQYECERIILNTTLPESSENQFNEFDTQEYVETLKVKERQRKNIEHQANKQVPPVAVDLGTDIFEKLDATSKLNPYGKMNQQSTFEKYYAQKWSLAHHNFKKFFETDNRRNLDDSDDDIRSEHAVKNEILRKGGEIIGKELEPQWELHKKLYAKRLRQRKRRNNEVCHHVVEDIVDIVMKTLLYRYENKRALLPRRLMNDWKEAFFRCDLTPFHKWVDENSSDEEETALLDEQAPTNDLNKPEFDSQIFVDKEMMKLLNESNLHCYLYLFGPWEIEKWSEFDGESENMTVNGFIVHRLLESKYPLPESYQDPKFNFKIRSTLSPIKDSNSAYIYNSLRHLLVQQQVAVLDIVEPMHYCLNTYHEEMAAIEDQENIKQTTPSLEQSSKRKSKSPHKRASKAGGRKSVSRKSVSRKSVSRKSVARKSVARKSVARKSVARKSVAAKKKGNQNRKSIAGKSKSSASSKGRKSSGKSKRPKDKAVQCPSVDKLVPRVNHTAAGLLGKEAFALLNSTKPISDLLSGKMLIEFLKAKKDIINGFALLSYPLSASQAVLLEFLMTGKPLKTDYKIKPEIAKFIHDELRPQPYIDTRVLVEFQEVLSPDLQKLSSQILDTLADPHTAMIIKQGVPIDETHTESPFFDEEISGNNEEVNEQTENNNTQVESTDDPTGNYPYWNWSSSNKRTASEKVLAEKIRSEAYSLGRYRPFLSEEAYEKMKNHIFELMVWMRTGKRPKRLSTTKNYDAENEEVYISEEEEDSRKNIDASVNETAMQFDEKSDIKLTDTGRQPFGGYTKPEKSYKQAVTYVQLLKLRASEILPRPNVDQMEIHYSTSSYMTKYIKCTTQALAKKEEEEYKMRLSKYEAFLENEHPGEEFILDPIIEAQPETYYKIYGQKEVFDYNTLDYDSITKLSRMMINEVWDTQDVSRKESIELFEKGALEKLMKDLPGRKKSKGKSSGSGKRKSKAGRRASKKTSQRKSQKFSKRSSKSPSRRQSKRASRRQSKRKSTAPKSKNSSGKGKKKTSHSDDNTELVIAEDDYELESIQESEPKPPPPSPPPPPPPKPGEDGWSYVEEFIPNIYQIYLATTWEAIEFVYLSNLLHLFYLMRTHDNNVIPYRNFIRSKMEAALLFEDTRMETVAAFQSTFNNVPSKFRKQSAVKKNLHCLLYTLYTDLTDFADTKRNCALAKRDALIKHRWVPKHLFTLSNLFLNLIQIEADRTVDSLQLLHDYYFAMLQMPPNKDRLEKLHIPKIFTPKRDISCMSVDEISEGPTRLLPWEKIQEKPTVPHYIWEIVYTIDRILTNIDITSIHPNPTHTLVGRGIDMALAKADELFDYYENLILDSELGRELRPKILKKLSPEEEKLRKKQEKAFRKMLERRKQKVTAPNSENRDSKPRKIRRRKLPQIFDDNEGEEEFTLQHSKNKFYIDASKLQMVDILKWEWLVAVQNEISRYKFRLRLLQKRAEEDLDEVFSILKGVFDEFFHDIGWQYRREIKAIDKVLETFKAAVDLEAGIQPPIVLDNDQFYVSEHHKDELYPEISPPTNTPIFELPEDFIFSMDQLNNFIRKIEDISPNGFFDKCFVDILEDMVTFNEETGYEFLPPGWSTLRRKDICFVLEQAFGEDYVINWRDFVLFCSGIKYPTVEEIIEMRLRFIEIDVFGFENIQYADFMNTPLWFEKDCLTEEEISRGQQMKMLLFKLFRTSRKEINYTDLLMTLCKGKQPEDGFGKALSLIVGVGYIFWPDPPDWIHPRHVIDYILIQLLHDVIIKADFTTVTTLPLEDVVSEQILPAESEEMVASVLAEECIEEEQNIEEIEEEEEICDKYKTVLWRTCVPYEACLALFFTALRFWALPPSHMIRQLEVEYSLKEIFCGNHVVSHIKAYKLLQTELVQKVFNTTSAFKECDLRELVFSVLLAKDFVVGASQAFENKMKIFEYITSNFVQYYIILLLFNCM